MVDLQEYQSRMQTGVKGPLRERPDLPLLTTITLQRKDKGQHHQR